MDELLIRESLRNVGHSFYGEIWENTATVPMGRGYANQGKPFDINSANYLRPIFQAIKDPDIPVIGAQAAVQMLKTFSCIEEAAAYFIQHDPGDMIVYIGGDDSARDQSKSRLVPRLRAIPGVARQIETAEAANRWDITTQEYYLPGMVLRIWGLNENTTQRISLRRVLISDAFLSKKTGLIQQAIARTTQYRDERKIIIESQGGEVGDDFDEFMNTTDKAWLHVKCPVCGQGQPFEFSRERKEGFIPTPPLDVPSLDHAAWVAHHLPILNGNERRFSGFKRGPDELVKRSDGSYNEKAILEHTYYECFHCGGEWKDNPQTRLQVDQSSYYVPTNPNALPGYRGFSWPAWAGQRLKWGGESCMLGYLRAKKAKDELGNEEPFRQWFNKRAARAWDPNLIRTLRIQTQEKYDARSDWPEEWSGHRAFVIDCQHELQFFWGSIWAVSKAGKSRQLWRGIIRGFDEIVKRQKEFGVLDQFVFLDGNYMTNELVEECAKHGHWRTVNGEKVWLCWTLLIGSPQKDFSHKSSKDSRIRFPVSDPFYDYPQLRVDRYRVSVEKYYFSALQMGDMAARYRDGGGPETLFLPETEDPENKLSWTAQVHSSTKQHLVNNRTGERTEIWKPATSSTPDHYWHVLRMFCVVHTLWGLAGTPVTIVPAEK